MRSVMNSGLENGWKMKEKVERKGMRCESVLEVRFATDIGFDLGSILGPILKTFFSFDWKALLQAMLEEKGVVKWGRGSNGAFRPSPRDPFCVVSQRRQLGSWICLGQSTRAWRAQWRIHALIHALILSLIHWSSH